MMMMTTTTTQTEHRDGHRVDRETLMLLTVMMMMMMVTETQLGDGHRVDRDRDADAAVRDDDHRGRGVGDWRLRLLRSEGSNPFCSALLARKQAA